MPEIVGKVLEAAVPALFGIPILGTTIGMVAGWLITTSLTNNAINNLQGSESQPSPRPGLRPGESGGRLEKHEVIFQQALQLQRYVYGETFIELEPSYVEETNNGAYLHIIYPLAGHEIQSVEQLYLNEAAATVTSDWVVDGDYGPDGADVRAIWHLGDQTAADADLLAESAIINSNFIGNEISYLYLRFRMKNGSPANVFGIPRVGCRVKGKKVYDPRSASTAYSANAALCIRDFMLSDYGYGASVTSADLPDAFWNAEANVCDTAVSLSGGGTEAKYEINGSFESGSDPDQIRLQMLAACGGSMYESQGQVFLKTGYYVTPTTTLDEDDVIGAFSIEPRVSIYDNFNTISAAFKNASDRFRPDQTPFLSPAGFLTEDDNREVIATPIFDFVTSETAAQRLQKMMLYRSREQMTVSADFRLNSAVGLAVMDTVTMTMPTYFGGASNTFEVVSWQLMNDEEKGLFVSMTLRETSSAAYSWTAEESAIVRGNVTLDYAAIYANNGNNIYAVADHTQNHCWHATSFDNSLWIKSNSSVSANDSSARAPDNTTLADKLISDTTPGVQHHITYEDCSDEQGNAFSNSDRVILSTYARADEYTAFAMRLRCDIGAGYYTAATIRCNLTNGTISSTSADASITLNDYGSELADSYSDGATGWYRIWADITLPSSGLIGVGIRHLFYPSTGSSETYTGDGSSGGHLWGTYLVKANADNTIERFPGYEFALTAYNSIIANGSSSSQQSALSWSFKQAQKDIIRQAPRVGDVLVSIGHSGAAKTLYSYTYRHNGTYWEPQKYIVAGNEIGYHSLQETNLDDDAVVTRAINDSAVTTAKINDDAITTVKVVDNAISDLSFNSSFGPGSTTSTSYVTIVSLTFSCTIGNTLLLDFSSFFGCDGASEDGTRTATLLTEIDGTGYAGITQTDYKFTEIGLRAFRYQRTFVATAASHTISMRYKVDSAILGGTAWYSAAGVTAIELKK